MRGIVRPCRSHLGPELHARWQAHLCGLCLTLRDVAGQPERVLTGYDTLLLSVLVEAQAGHVATTEAAPCPLRGFTRATVVASSSEAGRLAAAGALVSAAAGLADKLDDGDLPRPAHGSARRIAGRLTRTGSALAAAVGLDPAAVLAAPGRAAAAQALPAPRLAELLAPTGEAVASLFAHTALVAGVPANAEPLRRCGDAFGRLVHLLDAVEDHASDASAGRFNPLAATGTDVAAARALADALVAQAQDAMTHVALVDRALVDVLLGGELSRAASRVFPRTAGPACTAHVPTQRSPGAATLVGLWAALAPAVIIGGSWGGGGFGRRRRRRYSEYDEYGGGYGYRRVGPSCGQLLACNCCANCACNACCCGCQNA